MESQTVVLINTVSVYLMHCSILLLQDFPQKPKNEHEREQSIAENEFLRSTEGVKTVFVLDNPKLLEEFTFPTLKLSEHCTVVVTHSTQHNLAKFIPKFINSVDGHQRVLSRRDRDYFIFATDTIESVKIIAASEIFRKLKYRIILAKTKQFNSSNDEPSSEISIFSTDLFAKIGLTKLHSFEVKIGKGNNQHQPGWLVGSDSETTLNDIFVDYTNNLSGQPLRVAITLHYYPYFEVQRDKKTGKYYDVRGLMSVIQQEVRKKLNTTYDMFPCNGFGLAPDGSSGVLLKNGTFIGCIGDVIAKRADLAMLVSGADYFRYGRVESGSAAHYSFIQFVTRKPRKLLSWKAIYKSFTWDMWASMIGSTFITAGLIWLGNVNYLKRCYYSSGRSLSGRRHGGVWHHVFNLFQGLLNQPMEQQLSISSKFLILLWLLYALIISTAYTSKLTALISFPETEALPKTMRQLSRSAIKVGAPKSFQEGIGGQIFKNSPAKFMRKIYKKTQLSSDDLNCLDSAISSDYACISWTGSLDILIGTRYSARGGGDNLFALSTDTIYMALASYVGQKREPIVHRINRCLQMIYDTGVVEQILTLDKIGVRLKLMKEAEVNPHKKNAIKTRPANVEQEVGGLTAKKLFGSFLIYTVGLAFAICVFTGEYLGKIVVNDLKFWKQKKRNMRNNKRNINPLLKYPFSIYVK